MLPQRGGEAARYAGRCCAGRCIAERAGPLATLRFASAPRAAARLWGGASAGGDARAGRRFARRRAEAGGVAGAVAAAAVEWGEWLVEELTEGAKFRFFEGL